MDRVRRGASKVGISAARQLFVADAVARCATFEIRTEHTHSSPTLTRRFMQPGSPTLQPASPRAEASPVAPSVAVVPEPVAGRFRVDSATSLWRAAEYGDVGRLKMLLDAGYDVRHAPHLAAAAPKGRAPNLDAATALPGR